MKLPLVFLVLVVLRLSSVIAVSQDVYKNAVLADKPFAYYRLSESANTEPVADEIGNNPGVYVNDPKVGVPGAISTDRKDTAVLFDRQRQQFVKLTTFGSFGRSLSFGFSAENGNLQLGYFHADIAYKGNDKRLRLYCRDDHWHRFEANFYPDGKNINIFDDHWHHIVHVYNPGAANVNDKVLLFVDGDRQTLEVGQKGGAPKFSDFANPLTLAARAVGGEREYFLDGSLDEVAFYVTPLSKDQIRNHYRAAGGERKKDE
jgi:hypothetical protein